ncbi:MAG: redoxin domain-containing protein [Erysipelotrichaceae bacterium]|nr:redoxin domain-containing protein [Erysipelotrichaceae bacterium]
MIQDCSALFLEGLLSFFSPCVLPLVPLYIGYLTSGIDTNLSKAKVRIQTTVRTLFFVLGISTVFFLAGLGSSALRYFFQKNTIFFSIIGGFLLILFGLFSLGIIDIPFLQKEHRIISFKKNKNGIIRSYLLGFFFSFAWSPCVGPLLASAMLKSASAESALIGWLYIGCYTLGFIIIFILLGLFTEEVLMLLKKHTNIVRYTKIIGGIVVLCMGIYMLNIGFTSIKALENKTSDNTTVVENSNDENLTDIEKYSFTLKDNKGNDVTLSEYKGKTVVLNFFATWCTYCKMELPSLEEINSTRDDIVIFLVATPNIGNEGSKEYIESFMEENGYSMTVLYDETGEVVSKYNVSGLPTSFFFKPDGSVLGYVPGYVEESSLISILEECQK